MAEQVRAEQVQVPAHRRVKPGRKPLDAALPREVIRHELPETERVCPHDGATLQEIGVETSEQLDIVPQIPQLYQNFKDVVLTDMTLTDILSLVPLSMDVQAPRIRSFSVSGPTMVNSWITPGGAYVLIPNYDGIYRMLQEALGPPAENEINHLRTVVEIWNGSLTPNMDTLAAERLNYAGYQPLTSPSLPPAASTTLLYDLTLAQDLGKSRELLALFGLSAPNLRSEPTGGDAAYRLVLGNDFNPCFSPFLIER